jgi:exodeoxyribonuclease VII small subunit
MKNHLTFDSAFQNLIELVAEIEDDKIQLDTLAEKIKAANELIKLCEDSLRKIETDLSELKSLDR